MIKSKTEKNVSKRVKLSTKNQIAIPVELVHQLHLKPGDSLIITKDTKNSILIHKEPDYINEFVGFLRDKGVTYKNVIASKNEIRMHDQVKYGKYDKNS